MKTTCLHATVISYCKCAHGCDVSACAAGNKRIGSDHWPVNQCISNYNVKDYCCVHKYKNGYMSYCIALVESGLSPRWSALTSRTSSSVSSLESFSPLIQSLCLRIPPCKWRIHHGASILKGMGDETLIYAQNTPITH